MRNYTPQYFLINGKFHPNTDPITAPAGHKVLLRYVNAGVQQHSAALLGLRQNFIAKDGSTLPLFSHSVVAETIGTGESGDAITTIPASATNGIKYPLYDARFTLHNGANPGMGGMLTFLTVGPGTSTYPTTTGVTLTPNPTDGTVQVTVNATVTSNPAILTSSVTAAEFFIDSQGANGSGTAMSGTGTGAILVSGSIPAATMATFWKLICDSKSGLLNLSLEGMGASPVQ